MTLACVVTAGVIAGLTLLGWATGNLALIVFPTPNITTAMMPSTALALILCSAALFLVRAEETARGSRRLIACLLTGPPALLGALVLAEYLGGIDLGIDRLLFPHALMLRPEHWPGRPSITASLALVCFGTALYALDARSNRLHKLAELLTLVIGTIVLIRTTTFIFAESGVVAPNWTLYGDPILRPMSPKTSVCLLALAVGMLFARPTRGLVRIFLARGPAAPLIRWLMPAAVVLPILFGELDLLAIRANLHGGAHPLSLLVCAQIILLLFVIGLNARTIYRVDQERCRQERQLHAVFDNAGAGLALLDCEGRAVTTNKTLRKMLGYSAAELTSARATDFTHPDDKRTARRLVAELMAAKRDDYSIETRYVRKDGSVFWGHLNASVARTEDNQPEFLVGMVLDITERKEAEEALTRFKAVLDATPDFVGMADASGKAIYVNPAGRELTGIADGISDLNFPDFHPPEVAQRLKQNAIPVALRRGVWTGESELMGIEGERIPVSQVIIAHRSNGNHVSYFSTIMRDIREQKHFLESQRFLLEASRAFSGSLEVDTVMRSIVQFTVPERADYCAVQLTADDGRVERKLVAHKRPGSGAEAGELPVKRGDEELDAITQTVIKGGKALFIPRVTDDWRKRLIGTCHVDPELAGEPRSIMFLPLRTRNRVTGVICIGLNRPGRFYDKNDFALAQNFASRAALAIDNARLFQESREATQMRDDVLRVVAHDLRNPLNTIALSAGLLSELPAGDQDGLQKQLTVITRSIAFAERMIRDLLDVASVQAGRLSLEMSEVDPRGLLLEAIELQQPAAADKEIQLLVELGDSLSMIRADRHRVHQVLANIIGNAIKFSPQGSSITIGATQDTEVLRISIQDHGPGLSADQMVNLFDPFWQAQKDNRGVGLGLPIAKGIVEAHGGRIHAESKPGEGTTFYFTLPTAARDSGSLAAD